MRKSSFSLRTRIHYWLCDQLNIVSQDYFVGFCENIDKYLAMQNSFNQLVGKKLKLKKMKEIVKKDKDMENDSMDKGMFG